MRRTEPPPLAAWMLEHARPEESDEALAGDLLEGFRSGRSDGWYWRQALAACAVSWSRSLRGRTPLLVFALLWSMLAPAWEVFIDSVESAPTLVRIWPYFGPVWFIPALAGWLVLNSIFLWVGILVFFLAYLTNREAFRIKRLRRAFLLASLVLLPAYGLTFVWGNLYWYTLFAEAKLPATTLGQITDLRILADAMRLPYFIALVCALWNAIPRSMRSPQMLLAESTPIEVSDLSDDVPLEPPDPYTAKRFFGFMVAAGLVNAMIAGRLLCQLPDSHTPALSALLTRATFYVALGAIGGVIGAYAYWKSPSSLYREHPPIPFPLFALACASGWIWVPSMMLFWQQISAATAFVAAIGATLLAIGLRKATWRVFAPAQQSAYSLEPEQAELFADTLYRAPQELDGFFVTLCLYTAGCALFNGFNLTAAALVALGAFLFAWKRTFPQIHRFNSNYEYKRAALRLAIAAIPAVLITVWALLDGVAHRNHLAQINAAFAAGDGNSPHDHAKPKTNSSGNGIGGYESIILWPVPEKKQIAAPLPSRTSVLAPGTTQPLVIRFDGAYWYFQPPGKRPGPDAHMAHGTPLAIDIQSNNFIPLVMEAHQTLGSAIPLARCREIQVGILNSNHRPGTVNIAVLLSDSAQPNNQLYLGQQPVTSSLPGPFAVSTSPASETLRFPISLPAKIRKFDEVTVLFLPDDESYRVGPKIAIQQFQLLPR